MIELIKKLSQILNDSYNENSLVTALEDFFIKNFKIKTFSLILDEEYSSKKALYPLHKHNKVIGYIEFNEKNNELDDFLNIAIGLISIKVQNIILSSKMQRAIDFQDSMKNIAKIIETQYELQYIIPLLGEMIDKFVQNHLIYIFIKQPEGKYKLIWPGACKDNKIFDIINAEPLKRVTTDTFGVFPLINENKVLGYIITKKIDTKLSYKEIEYLDELANQSAITISRANTYAEILKHATLDALTGFYNRHQLEERINQEIASSHRQKTPLCAIMIDIDYFKKVNDTYGHAAGDIVLKSVAKLMRSGLREYDVAGRYGGEEFVILLPFTNIDEAKMVAERLRKIVESKVVDISKANNETKKIHVTISVGVSQLDKDEDLIKNADKALYIAKESGRNKVVIHEI